MAAAVVVAGGLVGLARGMSTPPLVWASAVFVALSILASVVELCTPSRGYDTALPVRWLTSEQFSSPS